MANQYVVVSGPEQDKTRFLGEIALFNEDGTPWTPESGAPAAVSWTDVTGKPSTFAPTAHKHPISDVTGLEARLAAIEGRLPEGGA